MFSFELAGNLFDLKLRKNCHWDLNCYVKNDDPMFGTKKQWHFYHFPIEIENNVFALFPNQRPMIVITNNEQTGDDDDEFVVCRRLITTHEFTIFFVIIPPETRESLHWKTYFLFWNNVFYCSCQYSNENTIFRLWWFIHGLQVNFNLTVHQLLLIFHQILRSLIINH